MSRLLPVAYLLLAITGVCTAHAAPEPESDRLGAAIQKAKTDKRVVLAVFAKKDHDKSEEYRTDTLADTEVKAWIEKNAVLCEIAVDDTERTKEFFVVEYPTTVFISSESVILGRIEKSCAPDTLLEEGAEIVAGTTALAKARTAYAQNPKDVTKRFELAEELAEVFDLHAALDHFLWLFDNVLKHDPAYTGVRLSFMLGDIVKIGERYPKALDELRSRRDAARKTLLAAPDDLEAGFSAAMDFTSINDYLGDIDGNLKVNEELKKNPKAIAYVKDYVNNRCIEMLVDKDRYKEAADLIGDIEAAFNKRLRSIDNDLARFESIDIEEMAARLREATLDVARRDVSRFIGVACGCGNVELARILAKALIEKVKDGKTYAEIISVAVRAEATEFAKSIRDEGLKAFDKAADLDPIREAAKEIPTEAKPEKPPKNSK